MPWIILIISAVLEAVWANALSASDGFSRLGPTLLFLCSIVPSMVGLSIATRHIPISTGYAVWAGLGAVFTMAWSFLTGAEAATPMRIILLAGIVVSVVGLKLLPSSSVDDEASGTEEAQAGAEAQRG